ncbi:MAG: ABC transporter substrate-binding protein [Halieaceae bacterium]
MAGSWAGALLGLLLCLPGNPLLAQQRIASLNLCTDLLLLELVEPERIVSLSYWAADPDLSYLAERASGLTLNHSLVEEIVPQQPDLVLAGQYSDVQVVALLRRLGYPVAVMDVPLTLAGMRAHILEFGELVGEPERALALADQIDAGLAAAAPTLDSASRPLAAVYGPQGVSPGRDTLMNDLLYLAGYRNLAAELGVSSYGTLSLETLVRAEPDVLVLDNLANSGDSIAHRAMRHPVLRRQFAEAQLLHLPASLSVCVGPTVVTAVQRLVAGRPQVAVLEGAVGE